MPDDQGELSEDEKATVHQWLESRWKADSSCYVCKKNSWMVGGHTVAPMRTTPKGAVGIGGILYPQVMVICSNCGYTIYFNAALMDLVESRTEAEARAKVESGGADGGD